MLFNSLNRKIWNRTSFCECLLPIYRLSGAVLTTDGQSNDDIGHDKKNAVVEPRNDMVRQTKDSYKPLADILLVCYRAEHDTSWLYLNLHIYSGAISC